MREDLGAQFARITQRLIEAERPLLAAHELTMWQYVVLARLAAGAAPTQLVLAADIGHDKTRLIPLLDGLEAAGLIARPRDPADRRARIVELTPSGHARFAAAQGDIHRMEDELMVGLASDERDALTRALSVLAERARDAGVSGCGARPAARAPRAGPRAPA